MIWPWGGGEQRKALGMQKTDLHELMQSCGDLAALVVVSYEGFKT